MATANNSSSYDNLCKTASMFCEAKGLDAKAQLQLATMIALAIRIGMNGEGPTTEECDHDLETVRCFDKRSTDDDGEMMNCCTKCDHQEPVAVSDWSE